LEIKEKYFLESCDRKPANVRGGVSEGALAFPGGSVTKVRRLGPSNPWRAPTWKADRFEKFLLYLSWKSDLNRTVLPEFG
jgi:hypothetical protein